MGVVDDELRHRLADALRHRARPLTGRRDRATTPVELLYDLTYVIAFATAAELLAHHIVDGAALPAIGAYVFAVFAVTWAWLNFTWFSSAYANDDAVFRVATIVQMIGAVIMVFGLPSSFDAVIEGRSPLSPLVIAGYVVMRVPLIALWLRAAKDDPAHAAIARGYALSIAVAQAAWVLIALLPQSLLSAAILLVALALAELSAPVVLERRLGRPPWHADHLAERFGLLTLITLGEVIAATTVAVGALVEAEGWSVAAVTIASAGIVLAAALWWAYYLIPSQVVLPLRPDRVFAWRYAHLPMFGAVTAVGAGLRVAAATVAERTMPLWAIALCLAIPVALVLATIFLTWSLLLGSYDLTHVPLFLISLAPLAAAVIVGAAAGPAPFDHDDPGVLIALVAVVALVTLGTVVEVVGHEMVGYRHTLHALEQPRHRPPVRPSS